MTLQAISALTLCMLAYTIFSLIKSYKKSKEFWRLNERSKRLLEQIHLALYSKDFKKAEVLLRLNEAVLSKMESYCK